MSFSVFNSQYKYDLQRIFQRVATVSGSVDVTVNVTGVSASGLLGSVSVTGNASVPVTGVAATGSLTSVSVTGTASVPVTGVSTTAVINGVTVTGDANYSATGVTAVGAVTSVSVSGNASVDVSGVSATGVVNDVAVTGDANVDVTGVVAIGVVGDETTRIDVNVQITGVTARAIIGDVSANGTAEARWIDLGRHPWMRKPRSKKEEERIGLVPEEVVNAVIAVVDKVAEPDKAVIAESARREAERLLRQELHAMGRRWSKEYAKLMVLEYERREQEFEDASIAMLLFEM